MTLAYEIVCPTEPRERWLMERRKGVTATDLPAILGISPWKSALALYAEKVGDLAEPEMDSEAMEWGVRLEPVIAKAFSERSGRTLRAAGALLRSSEFPWALATPDCFDEDGAPVEIKTAGAYKAADWEQGAPPIYAAQVQWQMLVTGAPKATIACLIGGQRMVWQDIERDERFLKGAVVAAARFWQGVEKREPPLPDGSDSSRSALTALYPGDDLTEIMLPADLVDAADDLERVKAQLEELATTRTMLENRIKLEMGAASRATLPDGRAFSWVVQEKAAFTVKASSSRVFRAHKPRGDR